MTFAPSSAADEEPTCWTMADSRAFSSVPFNWRGRGEREGGRGKGEGEGRGGREREGGTGDRDEEGSVMHLSMSHHTL